MSDRTLLNTGDLSKTVLKGILGQMKKTSEKSKTSQVVQCKEYTWQCRGCKRYGFIPWVRKILWNRKWQPTPVFLPGKLHGQRSLVGYNPWGCKESDRTVQLSIYASPEREALGITLVWGNFLAPDNGPLAFPLPHAFLHSACPPPTQSTPSLRILLSKSELSL